MSAKTITRITGNHRAVLEVINLNVYIQVDNVQVLLTDVVDLYDIAMNAIRDCEDGEGIYGPGLNRRKQEVANRDK